MHRGDLGNSLFCRMGRDDGRSEKSTKPSPTIASHLVPMPGPSYMWRSATKSPLYSPMEGLTFSRDGDGSDRFSTLKAGPPDRALTGHD